MFRSRRTTSPQFSSGDGTWTVLQGKRNDEDIIVRIDTSYADDVSARDRRSQRIGFAIPFNDGVDPLNHDLFSSIEDEIVRLTKDTAVVGAVATTPRMKEFVLHSIDASWAPAARNLLQQTFEQLEVQMLVESDPLWGAYLRLLDGSEFSLCQTLATPLPKLTAEHLFRWRRSRPPHSTSPAQTHDHGCRATATGRPHCGATD